MAGDPIFLQALDELRALHLSKGADYADEADPLRNYQQSADDNGITAWRAAQLRLSEKYHRLMNLTRGDGRQPEHESLDDTLIDIAAIALIVRSLRRREPKARVPHCVCQRWQIASDRLAMLAEFPPEDGGRRWQHADPGDEAEL